MYKTLKLRIYTKHTPKLVKLAAAVNFVWNYVNDLSFQMWRRKRVFLSAYDIHEYTKGAGEELGLHSQTLQAVGETHAKARKQAKRSKLNWRTNRKDAKRKSLGWIPFKASAVKVLRTYNTGKTSLKSQIQLSCGKEKLILTVYDQYDLRQYTEIKTAERFATHCSRQTCIGRHSSYSRECRQSHTNRHCRYFGDCRYNTITLLRYRDKKTFPQRGGCLAGVPHVGAPDREQ